MTLHLANKLEAEILLDMLSKNCPFSGVGRSRLSCLLELERCLCPNHTIDLLINLSECTRPNMVKYEYFSPGESLDDDAAE